MRIEEYSISSLAWLGDAVYELAIRQRLLSASLAISGELHRQAIEFVSARAQARALLELWPRLDGQELNIVRRARNYHAQSLPKHQKPEDYRLATALEALIGWHELRGETERNRELIDLAFHFLWGQLNAEHQPQKSLLSGGGSYASEAK